MNDGQEAFRRLAKQLRTVRGSAGGTPGGRGLFAGSGLLIALAAGGFALNASLFNGAWCFHTLFVKLAYILFAVDGGHRAIKYSRYERRAFYK